MVKKKSKPQRSPGARASWKGNLTFGLVSFTVEAFNALDRKGSDIHFHQIHASCHRRIHYDKVCPVHGVISNDEIVSGYEFEKGKYVEIDPDELDDLRTKEERALKIDAFVAPDAVDPVYYDGRMYYLIPAERASHEAYAVILAAMQKENQYAVGQIVFSGKNQIGLIRPLDDVLHMAMLNYSDEIRPPGAVGSSIDSSKATARQLKLAQSLIREWSTDDFDFTQYHDTYRAEVKKLLEAKVKGKKITVAEEEEEQPATINLMDALKKSLAKTKPSSKTKRTKTHSA